MSFSSDFNLWCAFDNKWQPQMDAGRLEVIWKLYSDVINTQQNEKTEKHLWNKKCS